MAKICFKHVVNSQAHKYIQYILKLKIYLVSTFIKISKCLLEARKYCKNYNIVTKYVLGLKYMKGNFILNCII